MPEHLISSNDWGKYHDYSVFGALDISTEPYRLVHIKQWPLNCDYILDVAAYIRDFIAMHHIGHHYSDAGHGEGQIDWLRSELPAHEIHRVAFTQQWKLNAGSRLAGWLSEGKLVIHPSMAETARQLKQFEYEIREKSGKWSLHKPHGDHDDHVDMLLLMTEHFLRQEELWSMGNMAGSI